MERRTRLVCIFPKPMRDQHATETRMLCAGLPESLRNAQKLRSHIENALPAIIQCVKALEPETYHTWLDAIVRSFAPRAKQVSGTSKPLNSNELASIAWLDSLRRSKALRTAIQPVYPALYHRLYYARFRTKRRAQLRSYYHARVIQLRQSRLTA